MDDKRQRYERFIDLVEVPMLVLALLTIPVIVMPVVENLSTESQRALLLLGFAIWALFVAEYSAMVYLAPDRRQAVMSHKLDLALVLLPFLRPLRIARLLRVAHAGTALARAGVAIGRLLGRPGFSTVVATVSALIVVGGGLVTIAEHDQTGNTISNFGDGLWWAIVTCTTVGYGDTFPVTSTGRVIAVMLMLAGISGLSMITANIAAFFISEDLEETDDEIEDISERLARIERQLDLLIEQGSSFRP